MLFDDVGACLLKIKLSYKVRSSSHVRSSSISRDNACSSGLMTVTFVSEHRKARPSLGAVAPGGVFG